MPPADVNASSAPAYDSPDKGGKKTAEKYARKKEQRTHGISRLPVKACKGRRVENELPDCISIHTALS
jgi:hypothetical protein